MAAHKSIRVGLSALMAAALAASGVLLTIPGAYAEENSATPTLEVEVTEILGERIAVEAAGAGYEEAAATTGEVRLGVVEKGAIPAVEDSVVAAVSADGQLGASSVPLEKAVHTLDETQQYEVVSWVSDADPTEQTVYARADAAIDWGLLIPAVEDSDPAEDQAEETGADAQGEDSSPSDDAETQQRGSAAERSRAAVQAAATKTLTVDIAEVPDEKIVIGVTGTGFEDVPKLPGQTVPHAYLAFVPKGLDLSTIGQDSDWPNVSADVNPDGMLGAFSGDFEFAADRLERGRAYEVISWPSRSEPTEATLYARADATIDWDRLFPVPEDGPTIRVDATEIADERVDFAINGTGFDGVPALPGQDAPHVYAKLHEKGGDLSEVGDSDTSVSLAVVDGNIRGTLSVPVEELDRKKTYEVITWPSRSLPTEDTIYTRADATIDWDRLFPADAPRVSGTVIAADEDSGLTVRIDGENIRIPEGDSASGVTVAVVERGKSVIRRGDAVDTEWVTAGSIFDGDLEVTLRLPKSALDRYTQYEVVLFKGADFDQKMASSNLAVTEAQWTAIFGKVLPATVTVDKVSVVRTGLNVDVSAKGLPGSSIYVAIIERGTEANLTQDGGYADFLYQPPVNNGAGKFNFVVSKNTLNRNKLYEVLIWKSHSNPDSSTIYGRADVDITEAQWDALANTTPGKKPGTSTPKPTGRAGGAAEAGSLTWGISASFYDYTTNKKRAGGKSGGQVLTSGVGGGPGGYVFPQAAGGNWNKQAQTGTVRYSGVVTFTAHKGLMNESFSNPVITVSSATSGTISAGGRSFPLNLAAGGKSVGPNGEVTWSGVPVGGSISGGGGGGGGALGVDPVTFTVGAASSANFGSTSSGAETKKAYQAAATPPTTEGLEILTPADKLVPGGRIEIQAPGFDSEDEGVLVVLYSEPIVLDDTAKADGSGLVQWSGTLPKDIELGEHVITLQGSANAGAAIEIVSGDRRAPGAAALEEQLAEQAQGASMGGILGAGGMGMWEWWASALGLVAIAACTTTLAVKQQRRSR